ncbi:amidohydrolase [Paenibacillus yonginensis]|uniref:Amidohydrolase n=1 Tax=Paenibacillus yonginensis TaxID=1462996 RepID=A0A1B1MZ92_9BACL|nr:amidohydrolase family protein [Paenibacillus yonginensis]ANS74495.1 amidohydrolase [Paenibacillus yonginensis]
MRIDAHQHYWKLARGDYDWITPDMPVLNRDYLPSDLAPHLKQHGMDGSIVVQAAATVEESDDLLSLAGEEESILGVVGWLDLQDPSYKENLERFRRHPKFVGIRVMIQEMPDAAVILQEPFIEAFTYLSEQETPVDLLVTSGQLDSLVQLMDLVPDLHGVVDHLAKPDIANQRLEPWKSQMKQIARHPNVYCKLSGMVTEADHLQWQPSDFTAYIHSILEIFGPDRVMFGSDWPVCLLAASYAQVFELLNDQLPQTLSAEQKGNIFGHNASRFYKLKALPHT